VVLHGVAVVMLFDKIFGLIVQPEAPDTTPLLLHFHTGTILFDRLDACLCCLLVVRDVVGGQGAVAQRYQRLLDAEYLSTWEIFFVHLAVRAIVSRCGGGAFIFDEQHHRAVVRC